ncbi:MAG: LTA synthase family protein [Muribaculaceae bacterium]|nr:LTA synthase family protein [Muribaculaceae bacterium]
MRLRYYPATLLQLFIPLLLLWLFRFIFTFYNLEVLGNPSVTAILRLSLHGLQFDLSAWAWLNSLFILMRFLPFEFVGKKGYLLATDIVYLLANILLLLPVMADIPFFQFNGAHLRWPTIKTIFSDPDMHNIIISFSKDYWWAFLSAFVMIGIIAWSAFFIKPGPLPWGKLPRAKTFMLRGGLFVVSAAFTFLCIRGHVGPGRPLAIGDAVWGTSEAPQINVVLNAPFCIIKTLHRDERIERRNFFTPEQLASIRSSIHTPSDSLPSERKNIMVITMESGSSIWLPNLTPVKNDTTQAIMPFLDSISRKSVAFPNAFTTGIRSIEGITNIFGGVPTFNDVTLMASPYFANMFDGPASLLRDEGYATRFYFGGNHGSFNIDQTLKVFGFEDVITREEYGNDKDFDGEWGIWDHKMGEYAARDLSTLPQPFMAGWFTLNPHAPFGIPDDWQTEGYVSDDIMRKTVEYEDRALRRFFEVAKTQPWYDNTIFILIGDHGFRALTGTIYDSSFIMPHIALMIFTPDGSLSPRIIDDIAVSQLDIPSTVLNLSGYPHGYVSLGQNILSPEHPGYALMFINGAFQICSPRYAVRLSVDMKRIEGVYDITSDYAMSKPLTNYDKEEINKMLKWGRAFLQDYTDRLNNDRMSLSKEAGK